MFSLDWHRTRYVIPMDPVDKSRGGDGGLWGAGAVTYSSLACGIEGVSCLMHDNSYA